MSQSADNIVLLYLMNQDTKDLSLMELIKLYTDTVQQVHECLKQSSMEIKGSTFKFD